MLPIAKSQVNFLVLIDGRSEASFHSCAVYAWKLTKDPFINVTRLHLDAFSNRKF